MTSQDNIKHNRFDNEQLSKRIANAQSKISPADQENGLLIIPECRRTDGLSEKRCVQEHHNAGHALWFFSMVVHALIHGTRGQLNAEKTNRIAGHLTCLREFLPDNDPNLRALAAELLHFIEAERPETYSKWLRFVYVHWGVIRSIAEHYGCHEKCFPVTDYAKVSDLILHKQWNKWWWWKLKAEKLYRRMKKWIAKART